MKFRKEVINVKSNPILTAITKLTLRRFRNLRRKQKINCTNAQIFGTKGTEAHITIPDYFNESDYNKFCRYYLRRGFTISPQTYKPHTMFTMTISWRDLDD